MKFYKNLLSYYYYLESLNYFLINPFVKVNLYFIVNLFLEYTLNNFSFWKVANYPDAYWFLYANKKNIYQNII